ncbi:MAG TPA: Crp/Fnr family transcriptional regulator [Thermodesulfobacteriota bacterium]|nr:Crp/Fnr family transcriptional regulator [Thermodesulfobacteriota bacterium]
MPISMDFLKSIPYFSALSTKELERVRKETAELSFPRGEILFLEGEPCRGLYAVKTGRVRIFKSSPEGREQVLLIAKPGESFNDVPVFDGGPNPASASALEVSEVYLIPKGVLLSLIVDCPAAMAILKLFAARLRYLTSVVEDLSFRSVVSRMARLLLELAVVKGGTAPVPRLTQDEMAARVGSVRDVIGRALKALEGAGAIRMECHRIYVVDVEKLKKMA